MSGRRVLLVLLLTLVALIAAIYIVEKRSANRLARLFGSVVQGDKLHAIIEAVEKDYVDSVGADSIENQVIRLFVQQLDPHSEYFTAEQLEEVSVPLRGDFDGIGVTYNMVTDTVVVQSVIAGGPSEKAGILMGDRFLSVDGHRIIGKSVTTDSVMHLLRGPRGTKVVVGLERKGVKDTLVFSIMAIENGEPVAHDTIISTKGGEFDFTMHLDSAAVMTVSDMANDKYDMFAGFYSVAVPGEEMVLKGNINKGWSYSGSKFYRELNEVEQAVQPINLEIRDFTAEWNKRLAAGKINDDVEKKFSDREEALYKKLETACLAFAKAHPDMEAYVNPRINQPDIEPLSIPE